VKHIVNLHGGTVRAESTLQMSTRIIISLPVTPVGAIASAISGP
jgi:signal transduction histidine kinase